MSDPLPFSPDRTVAALWRQHLAGNLATEKIHWRTKCAYYIAVSELIAAKAGRSLTWYAVVAAVRPKGSRTTFYEVTGRHAKHALVDAYQVSARCDSLQVALCYRRPSAVDQLIDETKVWAFWPYRAGWLQQCRALDPAEAIEAQAAVLAEWTRRNPELAAALDYSPPACAVEDLVAMHPGQLPASRACDTLSQVMRGTVAGQEPGAELDDIAGSCAVPVGPSLGPVAGTDPETLVLGLAEQIFGLTQETQRLAPTDAVAVRDAAITLMADAVAGLRLA